MVPPRHLARVVDAIDDCANSTRIIHIRKYAFGIQITVTSVIEVVRAPVPDDVSRVIDSVSS